MRSILKLEGYRGLYKGLSPALLANGVSWGGYFLFYEHAKNRWVFFFFYFFSVGGGYSVRLRVPCVVWGRLPLAFQLKPLIHNTNAASSRSRRARRGR